MTKLIVGNWKSNKSAQAVQPWFDELKASVGQAEMSAGAFSDLQVIIAPPFTLLSSVSEILASQKLGFSISLSLQDISPFSAGAYTGSISARNVEGTNIEYAIVGHSERRRYFHENHQDVANKVEQALTARITPIVCVDEDYLSDQAAAIDNNLLERCIVAYEPLAAIGTGNNADVGKVKEVMAEIKVAFGDVPVIYGGSVNAQNIGEYLLVSDGVLPGSSSLDGGEFGRMVLAAKI